MARSLNVTWFKKKKSSSLFCFSSITPLIVRQRTCAVLFSVLFDVPSSCYTLVSNPQCSLGTWHIDPHPSLLLHSWPCSHILVLALVPDCQEPGGGQELGEVCRRSQGLHLPFSSCYPVPVLPVCPSAWYISSQIIIPTPLCSVCRKLNIFLL